MNQTVLDVRAEPSTRDLDRDVACAKEPIHVPGGIQPHGYLVSLTGAGTVAQVSANITEWSGTPVAALPGAPLSQAIGALAAGWVLARLGQLSEGETRLLGTVPTPASMAASAPSPTNAVDEPTWAVIMHRFDGIVIVELERARGGGDGLETIYPTVRAFLNEVQRRPSIAELGRLAAARIAAITGFGRTLVYRFDHDVHGQVFAESLDEGYASYLGQRFPASDIPAQARDLYLRNRIRLIADADYTPVALVPLRHPHTDASTDLTLSSLRSVSPIHLQYMRNMGTIASMSMSIIVGERLWGLISCHHGSPRTPAFELRSACEHIAQILSLQIEASEAQSEATYRLDLRRTLGALLAQMANTENFVDALAADAKDLLGFTASAGAAIVFEGRITAVGNVPAEEVVWRLVDWLGAQPQDVVHSDAARARCPELGAYDVFAGFLAVSLSKTFRNYVIWFRPEVIQTIEWAGDPRAKLAALAESLSPRESFDTWTATVRDRSAPWRPAEVEIAVEFRTALLGIVLRRAEELAQLTMALARANRELEDFSYTVSHDLRAPLRHIHSFATLLQELDGDTLSERSGDFMRRIVEAADFGGRLVDDLLAFAQLGRAALVVTEVDMNAVVGSIVQGEMAERGAQVDWHVGPLPTVRGDAAFLRMVMQNLIENALKFSARQAAPRIEIGCLKRFPSDGENHVLFVKDNGVGFDMRYADKLFRVFQRLHRQEEYAGTGIGLANVKRIIERHGGQVRAESKPDQGATFFVSLPDEIRLQGKEQPETPAAAVARLVATGTRTPVGDMPKIAPRNRS